MRRFFGLKDGLMRLAYQDIVLEEGWAPALKWTLVVSAVLHAAVLYFGFAVLPDLFPSRKVMPPIYTVNLVTLPLAGQPVAPPARTGTRPKARPADRPIPVTAPKKAELIPAGPIKPKEPTKKPEVEKIRKPRPK